MRLNPVSVPSGFTKLGYPILYFPDGAAFSDILESDLGGVTHQSLFHSHTHTGISVLKTCIFGSYPIGQTLTQPNCEILTDDSPSPLSTCCLSTTCPWCRAPSSRASP